MLSMDFRSIFMGILFSVIWSSAFTSARILMTSAPPFLVLSLRFLISGILGIAIARLLGQNFNLSRQEWTGVLIFGFCQNVLNLGLNFVAMQWIDAVSYTHLRAHETGSTPDIPATSPRTPIILGFSTK